MFVCLSGLLHSGAALGLMYNVMLRPHLGHAYVSGFGMDLLPPGQRPTTHVAILVDVAPLRCIGITVAAGDVLRVVRDNAVAVQASNASCAFAFHRRTILLSGRGGTSSCMMPPLPVTIPSV